jgi:hypothetical protein
MSKSPSLSKSTKSKVASLAGGKSTAISVKIGAIVSVYTVSFLNVLL